MLLLREQIVSYKDLFLCQQLLTVSCRAYFWDCCYSFSRFSSLRAVRLCSMAQRYSQHSRWWSNVIVERSILRVLTCFLSCSMILRAECRSVSLLQTSFFRRDSLCQIWLLCECSCSFRCCFSLRSNSISCLVRSNSVLDYLFSFLNYSSLSPTIPYKCAKVIALFSLFFLICAFNPSVSSILAVTVLSSSTFSYSISNSAISWEVSTFQNYSLRSWQNWRQEASSYSPSIISSSFSLSSLAVDSSLSNLSLLLTNSSICMKHSVLSVFVF